MNFLKHLNFWWKLTVIEYKLEVVMKTVEQLALSLETFSGKIVKIKTECAEAIEKIQYFQTKLIRQSDMVLINEIEVHLSESALGEETVRDGTSTLVEGEGKKVNLEAMDIQYSPVKVKDWRKIQAQAEDWELLARATQDAEIQNTLLSHALSLRKEADAVKEGL